MHNNIKMVRQVKGDTQTQLAEALGVSRQTIFAIESGKYVPSTILALKLARYFGTTVEELFVLERID